MTNEESDESVFDVVASDSTPREGAALHGEEAAELGRSMLKAATDTDNIEDATRVALRRL